MPLKWRRINRPTSASLLSKQISTISAQSLCLASVVLGVPFDESDRKYTAPYFINVLPDNSNEYFVATGVLTPDGIAITG